MKVDATEGYPQHTSDDETYVTFDIDKKVEVLPTAPDSVQKFAFVRPLEPRSSHDMVLFDRQFRPTPKQAIAGFFAEKFLGAEEVPEAPQKTAQLYDLLLKAKNQSLPELEPEESERLDEDLRNLIENETVKLADIERIDMPAAARKELVDKVKETFPEGELKLSRPDLDRLMKVRTFKGSRESGLKVEVYDQFYDRVVKSVRPVTRRSGGRYFRVILHADAWEEVS